MKDFRMHTMCTVYVCVEMDIQQHARKDPLKNDITAKLALF